MHFDRAWDALREQGLQSVGYAPLLVARVARARREVGDYDGAMAAVDEGLEQFPDHTDLVLEAAVTARSRGDLAGAAALAERCLAMGDAPADYAATMGAGTFLALALLGEIRSAQGDLAASEELYRRCLREHPDYVAPVLPLVEAMLRRGVDPAEIDRLVPQKVSARVLAGSAYIEAGHPQDAERWFRGALEAQPANSAARLGLSEALLAQRRYAEAAAVAAAEPTDSPVAARAAEAAVFAHAVLGQPDGDGHRDRARPAEPGRRRRRALPGLGRRTPRRAGAGRPGRDVGADGDAAARSAPARAPRSAAFATLLEVFGRVALPERQRRELLATMYLRRGFLESAADEWIAVATTSPDASAMLGLAQVALARGFDDDAIAFSAEAVALDPAFEGARIAHKAIVQKLRQVA